MLPKKKTNYKNACAFVALDNSYETGHSRPVYELCTQFLHTKKDH